MKKDWLDSWLFKERWTVNDGERLYSRNIFDYLMLVLLAIIIIGGMIGIILSR